MSKRPILHLVDDAERRLERALRKFKEPFLPVDHQSIADSCHAFTDRMRTWGIGSDEIDHRRYKVLLTVYDSLTAMKLDMGLLEATQNAEDNHPEPSHAPELQPSKGAGRGTARLRAGCVSKVGEITVAQSSMPRDPTKDENRATSWSAIEISFMSDHWVQIREGTETKNYKYAELGFADRRNGNPNQAWMTLLKMAQERGVIGHAPGAGTWSKVEKCVQEIRKVLRNHFGIPTDPVPFVRGMGYKAGFKLGCGPSFHT